VRWRPGDSIAIRGISRGRIWSVFASTVVRDDEDVLAHLWRPGMRRIAPFAPDGSIQRLHTEWTLGEQEWTRTRVLWLWQPGAAWQLGHFWDDGTDELLGWYVNLQEPLRRTAIGFDTLDQHLDVVVRPDRSWEWKDEDELAESVAYGEYTEEQAAAIRDVGEQVIAALPELVPTGWEGFRPDPAWELARVPPGWDAL
jgi:hypothetical protein